MTTLADLTFADYALALFSFGLIGLLCMTAMPAHWQDLQGWAIVSFLAIPGALVVIAILVAFPPLLFGGLVLLGFVAAGK